MFNIDRHLRSRGRSGIGMTQETRRRSPCWQPWLGALPQR